MEAIELKTLLSQARDLCPGMKPLDYVFADYLAANLSDLVAPDGVALTLLALLDDIAWYRADHNVSLVKKGLPRSIRKRCNMALSQAPSILRIIGAVSEPEFANEVRRQCKNTLGWRACQKIQNVQKSEIPDSAMRAADLCVEWLRNISNSTESHYTEEEVQRFRSALAERMTNELKEYSPVILSFRRRNNKPHPMLTAAACSAGIETDRIYPLGLDFDYYMVVTANGYLLVDSEK